MQKNSPVVCFLEERCLIKISGADAAAFLQSLVTHDVLQLAPAQLVYSCLLTPQGRFLHDFFISKAEEGFFLECETLRRDDLIRRLNIFKLRAQVTIEDCYLRFKVYVASQPVQGSYQDPRLKELGYRFYLPFDEKRPDAAAGQIYKDLRIHLGVPEGSADIKPEIDTLSDVNLDKLGAISWDKGCYVGQEVTARMNYRGLVKKRMMIVSGQALVAGAALTQAGHGVGEIRSVNSAQNQGLAILKLAVLEDSATPVLQPDSSIILPHLPSWIT